MDESPDQEILPESGQGQSRLAPAHVPTAAADIGSSEQAAAAFRTGSNAFPRAESPADVYWVWAICGFLLLAVGLVFGQTAKHDFVGFDDPAFVTENPKVSPGLTLSGIWWALTDGTFGEWCPLSTLSQMLDCQLYGLDPAGHHLTNVLLHALSSVLLFIVLLRMTGDLWPSAWVAAVFAIHPLHVESVAWIAERRDVLSGLFFMLTLGAYALYAERPSLTRYLAVTGSFALGLMAKPILVTVPFLLLLLDYWPLGRFRQAAGAGRQPASVWWLVAEKIPLMVLAAAACAVVLVTHAATQSTNPIERLSFATLLANALVAYATYLGQSFYPAGLAPFYPHPGIHLSTASIAGASMLLVATTAAAACCWRRRPYLLVGWLWFLGMLVPVIGLVQLVAIARADRYTYLSQIGLSIALAWGVGSVYRSLESHHAVGWRPWTLATVSAAAVLALGAMAWRQTSYWRNSETLWIHTLASTDHNALAHYNLGYTYAGEERIEEAIPHLREACEIDSIDPQLTAKSHCVLADCLTKQGNFNEALAHYEQAVRIYPVNSVFHDRLAKAFARQGKNEGAIAQWREVIRLGPNRSRGYLGLADALLAHGDAAAAAAQCREILEQEPNAPEANVILGAALAAEGEAKDAIPPLMRAIEVDAQNARGHFVLGRALYDLGRSQSAVAHLNEAVRLRPNDVLMLRQTAWILATSPDPAIRDGERAFELAARAVQLSDNPEPLALDALAAALANLEKYAAAIDVAEQASVMALAHNDNALVDAIEQRTRQYRQGLPYREPVTTPPAGHAPPAATE